jgi:FtsZ-binding cell division protein ZapB
MELNKTIQDLKMEVEKIKKSQTQTTLEIENLGKRSGGIDASVTNTRDRRENLRYRRYHRKHRHNSQEHAKCKILLTQNIQEIQDTMRRPNQGK